MQCAIHVMQLYLLACPDVLLYQLVLCEYSQKHVNKDRTVYIPYNDSNFNWCKTQKAQPLSDFNHTDTVLQLH